MMRSSRMTTEAGLKKVSLFVKTFLFHSIYLLIAGLIILFVFYLTGGFDIQVPLIVDTSPWWDLPSRKKLNEEDIYNLTMILSGAHGIVVGLVPHLIGEMVIHEQFTLDLIDRTIGTESLLVNGEMKYYANMIEDLLDLSVSRYVHNGSGVSAMVLWEDVSDYHQKNSRRVIFMRELPGYIPLRNVLLRSLVHDVVVAWGGFDFIVLPLGSRVNDLLIDFLSFLYNMDSAEFISQIKGGASMPIKENMEAEIVLQKRWEELVAPYIWLLEIVIVYLLFICTLVDFVLNRKKEQKENEEERLVV